MQNTKMLLLALCTVASLGLGACANTLHGAGHDVENAGEAVESAIPPKQ